ncbi:ATP-binding cassette, subfamily C (CFTR/MRP), member 1 [Entomortierella parvispora]|uniref:ATP-binding cassette, subfamily C (CFTR/MRP), member 1 n=1 Tax=Entomortierella parvispora TaxID=205924 RepID=A0A9P3HDX4_9FUNG|nr:ATP-binding cassette, subfamily C (CFTR/MRP), member 1 [Entomortierella parvispora]
MDTSILGKKTHLCGSEGWGPTSPTRADLTLCFEYSIFYTLLGWLGFFLLLARTYRLRTQRTPHNYGRTPWHYWPAKGSILATVVLFLVQTAVSVTAKDYFVMNTVGSLTMAIAWFMSLWVNYDEPRYTIRSSNSLISFYIVTAVSTSFILHTLYDLGQGHSVQFILSALVLISVLVGLTAEAWPRGSTRIHQQLPPEIRAYDRASLLSQLTMSYFQPIVNLAAKQEFLSPADIANILPEEHETKVGAERIERVWNKRVQAFHQRLEAETDPEKRSKIKPPSLLNSILVAHWRGFVPIVAARILIPFGEILSPFLLGLLLDYIEGRSHEGERPLIFGLFIAVSIFVAHVLVTIGYSYALRKLYLIGAEIRSGATAMVYRKALRLSPDARRKSSTGAITNHMSVDAAMWEIGVDILSIFISLPLDFGLCIYFLYKLLGWSAFVAVVILVLLSPLQIWRAKHLGRLEDKRMEMTDERVRQTTEVLSNIKIVKLYGWEIPMMRRILDSRGKELEMTRRLGIIEAVMTLVFASSTPIISLVTFGTYVTLGHGELTPKVVFVSLTLLELLHEPIARLAEGTAELVSLIIATKRLRRFLLREEIDDSQIERQDYSATSRHGGVAIEIKDATMTWTLGGDGNTENIGDEGADSDDEAEAETATDEQEHLLSTDANASADELQAPALRDINLAVKDKSIVAVVGRVGMGKSSLLSAVIGDMYKLEGSISIRGRVAYVPQQAWIVNATLRDNILFGKEYDAARYRKVLNACSLEPDLAILPAGDMTEIGERGINLSGGQKQRVSLARAAYQDADVYLLDDPLSAVDAHVDRHLWENLIGPEGLLKDKTRILVTHGIHHLAQMDQIVVIKDGAIAEIGQYEELLSHKKAFSQLIEEFSVKHSGHKKRRNSHHVATGAGSASGTTTAAEDLSDEGSDEESDAQTVEEEETTKATKAKTAKAEEDDEEDELIAEEVMKRGGIEWRLVKAYAKACTYRTSISIVLINTVTHMCVLVTALWLKHWIGKSQDDLSKSIVLFLGVYTGITFLYAFCYLVYMYLIMSVARIRASEFFHRKLIETIVRLPMSFFDTTPLGRIVNRFSSDCFSLDEQLPWKFQDLIYLTQSVGVTLLVIVFTMPSIVIMLPFLAAVYYMIQRYFIWATRSLKRIRSVSISPVYQHFDETLNGVATIRAMSIQPQYIEENAKRLDYTTNAFVGYMYCNRWVELRLQIVSATIILALAVLAVLGRHKVDPSLVGLALNYAIGVTDSMMWLVRDYSEWQAHLVAIERIQDYTDKHTEAPAYMSKRVPVQWPEHGRVVFKNYSSRYREGLDLVVKHLSFEVQPGSSVGIVGRTGAGKSSLTLALFRIIEAANSYWARASDNSGYHERREAAAAAGEGTETDGLLNGMEPAPLREDEEIDGGSIEIDGVDIATLGLSDLRQHLAIIPQDPTLFAGTVRDNLDPFNQAGDEELWEALERAHLKDQIRALPGGLSHEVSQNGENFSVGQRSLICLARALLRKSKILILDEATAAVDMETDELIQKTIREEFKDRTVLTIAHRIKTVLDSNMILVMDKGEVVEFDKPETLLKNHDSKFFQLAHQAGAVST